MFPSLKYSEEAYICGKYATYMLQLIYRYVIIMINILCNIAEFRTMQHICDIFIHLAYYARCMNVTIYCIVRNSAILHILIKYVSIYVAYI